MRIRLSIRSFLLIFACCFAVIPLLLFATYQAGKGIEEAHRDAAEINRRIANYVERDIEGSIDQARTLFETIALDVDIGKLRLKQPANVRMLLAKHPFTSGLLILDEKMLSVAAYVVDGTPIPIGLDYADRPQVRQARDTKATAISRTLSGRTSGVPVVVITVPLLDAGRVVGFVSGNILAAAFRSRLTGLELPSDAFAFVVDSDGRPIAVQSADGSQFAEGLLAAMVAEADSQGDGSRIMDLREESYPVHVSTVQPIGWRVVSGVRPSFVESRTRQAAISAVGAGLVAAIVGGALVLFVALPTIRALRRASGQMARMSAGDLRALDLADEPYLPVDIHAYAETLNDLIARLARAKTAELEAITRVSDAILISDAAGRITYVNEAGVALLGPVRDRPLGDVVGHHVAGSIMTAHGIRAWRGDITARNADGDFFDGFLSTTPIRDGDQVSSIVTIIHDITREKAEREAVIQSEKMITLGELVAGTSHELNNPLAIVTGYADLLIEDPRLTADQKEKLASITRNARRAAGVVHNLLAFARKRRPERVETDINAVLRAAIQLKEYDLRTSGIEIEQELASDMPVVSLDPDQVQQVFLNTINNAQDALLEKPDGERRLSLRTAASSRRLIVEIADTGTGISKSDLKKVFDPFFTTKPVGKGTGLGLSISYGIVREHGGDIIIESQLGLGTQVRIELPLIPDTPVTDAVPDREPVTAGRTRLKVLVVDDEEEIIAMIRAGLSRIGAAVEGAKSMKQALNLASSRNYDFVLADIKMPGGSGIDLFRTLCTMDPAYSKKTIFMTGDISTPETVRFLQSEGRPFFVKPLDLNKLEVFLQQRAVALSRERPPVQR